MTTETLMQVATRSSVLLCCGSGGVGKTTASAALALAQMRAGRRVVVVTIDPARRLADALGVTGELGNQPTLLSSENGGELWAMMLDANETFANLVQGYSSDSAQVERIITNRFFRNISSSLGGTTPDAPSAAPRSRQPAARPSPPSGPRRCSTEHSSP